MPEKFDSLEELIEEYYELVNNKPECLPPYATFKTYLVEDDNCCDNGYKCIDRPTKIKELVNALADENADDNKKLTAILQLWSHGGEMYVSDNTTTHVYRLIHSVSNTTRLQVFLKGGKKDEAKGVIIDRENLLKFASEIGKYIISFEKDDKLIENPISHDLVNKDDFKALVKNNIDSVVNEILFWYYYEKDEYPIINSRAKNSRHILNKVFAQNDNYEKNSNDLEFNEKCMKILQDKECPTIDKNNAKTITKQLMLDQLFYSIDEMRSMKKVDETYSDKNDEIYKFYLKLWNTIKEAKINQNLKKKYKEFQQVKSYENWKQRLEKVSDNLHTLQKKLKEENIKINSYDDLNKQYREITMNQKSDFLYDYIFAQDNGVANAGQWGAIKTGDKNEIENRVKGKPSSLIEILLSHDINDAFSKIEDLFRGLSKDYKLIKNRFLAALFSEKMTTVAHVSKFEELVKNLKRRLNVKLESDGYIEQNSELMGIYLTAGYGDGEEATVYDKQIFYWWLYEKLKDNLDLKKAVVYYGAPGTGKTFKAKKVAQEFLDNWHIKNGIDQKSGLIEVVQFHPSFSYEDFIEGIRPSQNSTLQLRNGIFKEFCKKAGEIEIALLKDDEFKDRDFSTIKIGDLKENAKSVLKEKFEIDIDELDGEYSLIDIIPPAFFIIDEINRADLSRVFGELMYSLEYRGYAGKVKTQYSYMVKDEKDDAVYFYEDGQNYFFIPQNLYIIGTMNTIDRSVDSFDFALRRRFSWEEIRPDYDVIRENLNEKIANGIAEAFKSLNEAIKEDPLLGSDYQIGHSYALNLKNTDIKKIEDAKLFLWGNFIKPLLQEYFRGLGESEDKISVLKEKFGPK